MRPRYSGIVIAGIVFIFALAAILVGGAFFTTSQSSSNEANHTTALAIEATNARVSTAISGTIAAKSSGASAPAAANDQLQANYSSADTSNNDPQQPLPQKRIVLKNAQLGIVVKDTGAAITSITSAAEGIGGWVVTSNTYEQTGRRGNKLAYGSITVRVPADKFTGVIEQIKSGAVSVNSENVTGEDVTSQYADLNSRLTNLQAAEEQLRKIMDSTTKTDDVLSVYRELVRVRGEIEQIKGQLKFYDESASFSAIAVTVTPYEEDEKPIEVAGWRPNNTLNRAVESLVAILQGLADFTIWFGVVILPLLLPVLIIAWLIRRFTRNRRRSAPTPTVSPTTSDQSGDAA